MHPVCFHIGGFPIHCYGVMMALGFLAGLTSWTFLARREGRSFNFCSDLLFWIMIAGIIGARIAYVLSDLRSFLDKPSSIVRVDQGGLIFYGGFLGAWVAVYVFARVRKESFLALADFVVTALPLAHAFGRVGCFLNGCCFGKVAGGPCSVRYPVASPVWWRHVDLGLIERTQMQSLPVFPVQLLEAALNLLLYVFLMGYYLRRKHAGRVAAAYLFAYPAIRFFVEFLRGDERMRWMGLSVAQLLSLGLMAVGAIILARSKRGVEENSSS